MCDGAWRDKSVIFSWMGRACLNSMKIYDLRQDFNHGHFPEGEE